MMEIIKKKLKYSFVGIKIRDISPNSNLRKFSISMVCISIGPPYPQYVQIPQFILCVFVMAFLPPCPLQEWVWPVTAEVSWHWSASSNRGTSAISNVRRCLIFGAQTHRNYSDPSENVPNFIPTFKNYKYGI